MALSKAKLKAATEKYSSLHTEGKTEEEVRAAISGEFQDEAIVDEIYKTIASADKETYYIVSKEFRDLNDFNKVNEVGEDVTHFDQSRLDQLVELGLVEKQ